MIAITNIRKSLEKLFADEKFVKRFTIGLAITVAVGMVLSVLKMRNHYLDLYVFLDASQHTMNGQDIYTTLSGRGLPYLYLPLIAVLFIPLSMLPYVVAGAIWMGMSAALLGLTIAMFVRGMLGGAFSELSPFEKWALHLIPVIFCFDAITAEIGAGQVNGLTLAITVLGLFLAARGKKIYGGFALGIAFVAKVFSAPVIAYQAFSGRMKVVLGAAIGLAVGLGLPSLIYGPQKNLDYIVYWTTNIAFHTDLRTHPLSFFGNGSLQAVIARLFSEGAAFVYDGKLYSMTIAVIDPTILKWTGLAIEFSIILVLFAYRMIFRRSHSIVSYWGGVALALCVAPLITNVTERYHFVLLLPGYVYVTYLWICVRLKGKGFYALLFATFALSTLTLRIYVGAYLGMVFWSLGAPSLAALTLSAAIFYAGFLLRNRDLDKLAVD
ncbi:MAG: DUF2029 domain-containing protein [Acidobacteria bacterium]|nr:DUF2029 domain-containing protein [Acidobacteriota bacterium]